jgi:ankyrin repeat protein
VLFHEPKLCLLIHLFFSQKTPLMASASWGFVETCRLLVASKADVAVRQRCRTLGVLAKNFFSQSSAHSLRCSNGYTALKWAILKKNTDVIAYLRSIGAPE